MVKPNVKVAAIMCLVGIVSFSLWPLWQWLKVKSANAALIERTKAIVAVHPELKPAWNIAMHDDILTWEEAKEIVEGAGEKVDDEK